MVYSLYYAVKESSRIKKQELFDKSNKVLIEPEIEELRRDINSALPIFHSAIVDHTPVNGIPYHTFYPFKNLAQYSQFRKAAIAHGLYLESDKLSSEDMPMALSILEKLGNSTNENAKTRILAWNSLGKLGIKYPELFDKELENVRKALYENSASDYSFITGNVAPLGGTLFLTNMLTTPRAEEATNLAQDAIVNSKSLSAKVFLTYFLSTNSKFKNKIEELLEVDPQLKEFYNSLNTSKGSFNPEAREKGLSLCGIVQPQELPLWSNTSHKKWVEITSSVAGSYPYALGAFAKNNYASFARR